MRDWINIVERAERQSITEEWFTTIEAPGGAVEVFRNPSRAEFRTLSQQRAYGDLSEAAGDTTPFMYRWVDEKAAASYLRIDAMVARVRHYLPKKISGHFHSKFITGLSFSHHPTMWRADKDMLCFVVDRTKLKKPNQCIDINGQAIYNLTQTVDMLRNYMTQMTRGEFDQQIANVLDDCQTDPDEVFVIGDLRNLGAALAKIMVPPSCSPALLKKLQSYCAQHQIALEPVKTV